MDIHYVKDKDGKKMFSFTRYDYKESKDGTFIDGGFEYTRTNSQIYKDTIENLIEDIREVFIWGSRTDKEGNPLKSVKYHYLKDLTTGHIINILAYFTENITEKQHITETWKAIHLIFLNELKYRHEQNI